MSTDHMPSDKPRGHRLRRAASWLAFVLFGLLWDSYKELKHPSTSIRVIHLVLGIVLLVGLVAAFVSELPHFVRWGREARDWLWVWRQNWRDWRERRAGNPSH
jgi:hypothetical protein